jgi:hypothetical protein
MNPRSKEFKDLQKDWYKKLKDSGFQDIERGAGQLKTDPLQNIKTFYDLNSFESKQEYFRMAGAFLYSYKFKNEAEKLIWRLHSEGVSFRTIVKILLEKGYKISDGAYKKYIQDLIPRLREEMRKNIHEEGL